MKFKLDISFRVFDAYEERGDSGYYSPITDKKRAHIEADLKDDPFEIIMTVFHEVAHFVFDFLTKYKIEQKKRRISMRKDDMRQQWKNCSIPVKIKGKTKQMEREEYICQKAEFAISKVLKKHIPAKFFKKFFEKR